MSNDRDISLIVQAFWPAGIAALMQLAMTYAMSLKLRPAQLLGAILVSSLTAACVSILLVDVVHMPPTASAAFGAMTGALPAVILPVFVLRFAAKKMGIDIEDFSTVLDAMRHQVEGKSAEEGKSTETQVASATQGSQVETASGDKK